MTDLEKARCILQEGGYTCVLCKGDALRTSTKRGVAPLMALWEEHADVACFSAADKVVGKATALLYRLLGVKAVYAGIISESALETLRLGDIETEYGALVPYIVNREGTGRCPMETATADLDDPRLAPAAIKSKLAALMAKSTSPVWELGTPQSASLTAPLRGELNNLPCRGGGTAQP